MNLKLEAENVPILDFDNSLYESMPRTAMGTRHTLYSDTENLNVETSGMKSHDINQQNSTSNSS